MNFTLSLGDYVVMSGYLLVVAYAWFELKSKIAIIYEKVRVNEKNHYLSKEQMDLFKQQVTNEMNGFKGDHVEQINQSRHNATVLTALCTDMRAQSISQEYMRELVGDVKKSLDANTNATAGLLEFLRHQYGKSA